MQRLAAGLRDQGFVVAVAGFGDRGINGIAVHDLGIRRARKVRYLLGIVPLARVIRRQRPQFVNAHFLTGFGLMSAIALRLSYPRGPRPILIQTVWGTDLLVIARRSRIQGLLARISLRSADLVTGDSSDLEREVRRLAPGTAFHRFRFGPSASLLTAARHPRSVIVSSRRLDDDTQVEMIIAGFHEATNQDLDLAGWRLVVAGDGRRADALRTMAAGWKAVQFTGQLSATELDALLLRSRLFISIPRSDGTSAALLEAMAAGATPIVSDLPANREWVDRTVGHVIPGLPTVDSVASAIRTMSGREDNPEVVRAKVADVTWEKELDRLAVAFRTLSREVA